MKIPHDSLPGKIALVTGAASGLGRATSILLAQAGAVVVLVDCVEDATAAVVREIEKEGGRAAAFIADVRDLPQLEKVLAQVEAAFGRLDILFANAGINGAWAPVTELTVEEWEDIFAVNLKGTFITVRACVPLMKRSGGGSIIVNSSVNGTRMFSNTGASAYAASKAGQLAFARMLVPELAVHRIRVNTICPGVFATGIGDSMKARHLEGIRRPVIFPEGTIPLTGKEPGKPEQVANAVWFLASDLSSHITGTEIYIDGGQTSLEA